MDEVMLGAMLGALLVGLVVGMVPLFFGLARQKGGLGVAGFAVTFMAGLLLGLIGAIPSAGIFVYFIAKNE